jgi:hypothetical protein
MWLTEFSSLSIKNSTFCDGPRTFQHNFADLSEERTAYIFRVYE